MPSRRKILQCLAAAVTPAIVGCHSSEAVPASSTDRITPFRRAAFPLRRTPGKRYLVDDEGLPFLLTGDAAWSLGVQLSREDALIYLADRERRGFNTLIVSLLERKFSAQIPANHYGEQPFLVPDDYSKPNDRYFDHVEWLVRSAADRGQLVLLAPSYIGCCGDDGWYTAMASNGAAVLREYGRYLGRKFGSLRNIVWVHGGDGNPSDSGLVAAIALGIGDLDKLSLHTAHTSPEYEPMQFFEGATWLNLNNIYTYEAVLPVALRAYRRAGPEPFFLIESEYQGETHHATDIRIRAQAWQAMMGGAMGQVVGTNPLWNFASPHPITPFSMTWQQAMDSEASRSMTQLRRLCESFEWWRLRPDDGSLLVGGYCESHYSPVAAASAEGDLALVYVPLARRIELDLSHFRQSQLTMRWVDPVDGRTTPATMVSSVSRSGATVLRLMPSNERNAGGDSDRLLVITASDSAAR